jgi:hypothetical protein
VAETRIGAMSERTLRDALALVACMLEREDYDASAATARSAADRIGSLEAEKARADKYIAELVAASNRNVEALMRESRRTSELESTNARLVAALKRVSLCGNPDRCSHCNEIATEALAHAGGEKGGTDG